MATTTLSAADAWIYLKDGRVGRGDLDKTPVAVALADGTEVTAKADDIRERRTPEQVAQLVASAVEDMARGKSMTAATERMQSLKSSACDALLRELAKDQNVFKICALYSMQFCWNENTLQPAIKAMESGDKGVRRAAIGALCAHVKADKLAELLKPFIEAKEMDVAGTCFDCCERYAPDPTGARIRKLMADPTGRTFAARWVSHYYSAEMTPPTLAMIDRAKPAGPAEQRLALVGLIAQLADGKDVRERVAALLASPTPEQRELAAEYFLWMGTAADAAKLAGAAKGETDAYARACMEAAAKVITQRDAWVKSLPEGATQIVAGASLVDALHVLEASPRKADIAAAQKVLATMTFEPYATTGDKAIIPADTVRARSLLVQKLFCAPSGTTESHDELIENREYPAATKLVPPIRDYFDPKRNSYGTFIGNAQSLFNDSVHVGDDCGWQKELRTVVAIGPGLVRQVSFIPTWGHLVLIEHRGADGQKFCSLYGHLSPFLLIKPGDVVAGGQKIGCIGRQLSADNGGYFAHLHFGIHAGAYSCASAVGEEMSFRTPDGIATGKVIGSDRDRVTIETATKQQMTFETRRWIAGYLSPDMFKRGLHTWQDPQAFLQSRK